jgi:hypothetical protein
MPHRFHLVSKILTLVGLGVFSLLAQASAIPATQAPLHADVQPQTVWRPQNHQGIQAHVIVVPRGDWATLWRTQSHPTFPRMAPVARGTGVDVLVFFSRPATDKAGQVKVTCEVRVFHPDGTAALPKPFMTGQQGIPPEPTTGVFLMAQALVFRPVASDPAGVWKVQAQVTDSVSHQTQTVNTTFIVK